MGPTLDVGMVTLWQAGFSGRVFHIFDVCEAFPTQHKIPIKHMFSPTGL